MKTYIFNTINKYKQFSEKLDATSLFCNRSWIVFNEGNVKETYIFEEDHSLMITRNGICKDGTWKYIPANHCIRVNVDDVSYMFHPAFLDRVIFALNLDGTEEFSFMIDENNAEGFAPKTYNQLIEYFNLKKIEKENAAIVEASKQEEIESEHENIKIVDIDTSGYSFIIGVLILIFGLILLAIIAFR